MRALLVLSLLTLGFVGLGPACALAEGGEDLCDDDEDNDGDKRIDCADPGCQLTDACSPCGDGVLDDAEGCDDGNRKDKDGCDKRCRLENCGNEEIDAGEQCDDGNLRPGDGCNARCEIDFCGDGIINNGELCDDGNGLSGDGCSSRCAPELYLTCGNRQIDPLEQCDSGDKTDGDGCSATCQFEFCGDGIVQTALFEQCDGAPVDGTPCEFCRLSFCGNDRVDAGEQCDDGNRFDGDGCTSFCTVERCGDFFFSPGEECDDGNTSEGDGCNAECQQEFCGDQIVQPRLGELCDDGNGAACDGQCRPVRPCATLPGGAERCFGADVRFTSVLGDSAAVLREGAEVWVELASPLFGFVERQVVSPARQEFPGYPTSPVMVLAFDADQDGDDETLLSDFSGRIALNRFATNGTPTEIFTAFFDSFSTAIGLAAVHTAGEPSALAALALTGTLLVVRDPLGTQVEVELAAPNGATHLLPVPLFSDAAEPTAGLVIAHGASLSALRLPLNGPFEPSVSPLLTIGGDVVDIALADVDDDGDQELLALLRAPDQLVVMELGDGTVVDGAVQAPTLLAGAPGADRVGVGDLDGDGRDDLVTAGGSSGLRLHRAADGYVGSTLLPGAFGPTRPWIGDANGDGRVDIIHAGGFNQSLLVIYLGE